jgi:HAD superfamily hydrolase (TIGR01509 family)
MEERRKRAVFLDAMGTLVEMDPPWEHLRTAVPDEVDDERLVEAVKAEMRYYRAHAHEGRDPASLAELRERCAQVLSDQLGTGVRVDQLIDAVRFHPYPDVESALESMRRRDLALVVVSNWDCALPSVLEEIGLASHLDGVVSSAAAGARKPDPAIFEAALEIAGCEAEEAIHVGDTPEEDLLGARAASISALIIDRDLPSAADVDGAPRISELGEVLEHLR